MGAEQEDLIWGIAMNFLRPTWWGRHANTTRFVARDGAWVHSRGLLARDAVILSVRFKPRMHNWTTFATVIYTALGRVRMMRQKLHV